MKRKIFSVLAMMLIVILTLCSCSDSGAGNTSEAGTTAEQTEANTAKSDEATSDTADESTKEEANSFKSGTYVGEASGFGGTLVLEVTLSTTGIESIEVTENHETTGIGSTAIDTLPGAIVENQSLAVDGVTGATYSSVAIKEAVRMALEEAGADVSDFNKEVAKIDESDKNEVIETDILIVGGGGSGISAAIAASDSGADVLLIEKLAFLGGAASISGGQVNAGGSNYQVEYGVTDDSPEAIAADLYAGGHDLNDHTLVELYSKEVGITFDWLADTVGVEFEPDIVSAPEHSIDRIFIGQGKAAGINQTLLSKLESTGANIMLNTRADSLIMEEGAVTGVTAYDTNTGKTYTINAKTVVLATGGYGYNQELLPENLQTILYYGPVSSTGDGLIMATEIGAAAQMLEYGKIYPNGVEIMPGIARSTVTASTTVFNNTGTVLVDRQGNRVANETGNYAGIRDVMLEQEDETLFLVMDQEAFDKFVAACLENKYLTSEQIDQYLNNNGSTAPVFANSTSLTEAAEAAGIDADGLAATVERFNTMVANGEDEDFGRTITEALAEDSTYYIVEQKPRFATTLGGLKINDQMQVLDENGEAIPGLLAAGELVGGLHGDDSMPSVCVSWAFTSGRLAGQQAVASED